MKEWKERFEELFVIEKSRKEKYSREYGYITIVERLEDFIEQEIERVEQEAYERGVQDGMKGKFRNESK